MLLECYKFEIQLNLTGEIKELELIFVLDGIFMDETKMKNRIKEKLEKAAKGNLYTIVSCIYQKYDQEEVSELKKID